MLAGVPSWKSSGRHVDCGRQISGIDGRCDVMVKHLETETVSCGVQDPGVIIGTLDAGVKPQRFPRQFSCCEGAGVG